MALRIPLEIRFGDIDLAGVVYYPRLIHFFHVAMEEYFARVVGVPYPRVIAERRFGLPTVHLEVDFVAPVRYGDTVEAVISPAAVGESSVEWHCRLERGGETAVEGRVVTVGIDLEAFTRREVPDWLRERLSADPPRAR